MDRAVACYAFNVAYATTIQAVVDDSVESSLRPGIVHRLDKDTSGVMVVARNQKAFRELKNLFKNRKVSKKYLALVYGKPEKQQGIIEKPIARAANYKKQVVAGRKTRTKIREAITEYKVIKKYSARALVEVFPQTGRMHQIRLHLASLGNPVVGDQIYGKKIKKYFSNHPPRQLLHAQKIKFELFGNKYSFQAKIPFDFQEYLKTLDVKI